MSDPLTIHQLFEKDPLELTDEDVVRIVENLRSDRVRFAEEDNNAKKAGRSVKHKPDLELPDLGSISVEDL